MKKIIFTAGLLVGIHSLKAQLCLSAPVSYTAFGGVIEESFIADFNNDGNVDIAAIHGGLNSVSVFLGNGSGSYGTSQAFAGGLFPGAINGADFNGDGYKDLAISSTSNNNVKILLGSSTGSFTPGNTYTTGSNPLGVQCGDFNNDGKQDLIVSGNGSNFLTLLLGDGAGNFNPTGNFSTGSNPRKMALKDYNNDGNLDVACVNNGANTISLLLGLGNGSLSTATNFTVGTQPNGIYSADFNGDGNFDLAVSNDVTSNVSVLLGTGTGNFATAVNYTVDVSPRSVFCADFNSDGFIDLATSSQNSGRINLLFGNGAGTFPTVQNFTVTTINAYNINGADFNNDTKPDFAVLDWSASAMKISLNSTPKLNVSTDFTQICVGNSVTINASGSDTYNFTGGISNAIAFTPSVTSTYSITGFGPTGCTITANSIVTITVNTAPLPTLSLVSSPPLICSGEISTLTISGANTYTWSTGSTASMIAVQPTVTTTYSVTGVTTSGCYGKSTVTITVYPCTGINELYEQNYQLEVYPNPNNGSFSIRTSIGGVFEIYNQLGQSILKFEKEAGVEEVFKIDNLADGVYYMYSNSAKLHKKIIVTK